MNMRFIREIRDNGEDEIEVLGTTSKRKHDPWKWLLVLAILAILIVVAILYVKEDSSIPEEEISEEVSEEMVMEVPPLANDSLPSVVMRKDSINDVVLDIYALHDLEARLSLSLPEKTDTAVRFVLQAADIRKDNKQILGDFVLDGEQLSRGKRKTGYCAIVDGKVTLGNSDSDEMKDHCIERRGDFFRQYPLVMDGEVIINALKGKANRRALARQGDDLYVVMSRNRESLYDFSEALADMGFTDALYLVGGTSYGWCRIGSETYDLGVRKGNPFPNANYIVFSDKRSFR